MPTMRPHQLFPILFISISYLYATEFPSAQSPRVKQDCIRYLNFGLFSTYDNSSAFYERVISLDTNIVKFPAYGLSGGLRFISQRKAPVEIQWSLEFIMLGCSIGFQLKHNFASLINPSDPFLLKNISFAWIGRANIDIGLEPSPGGLTGNLGVISGSKLSESIELIAGAIFSGNFYSWGNADRNYISSSGDTIDVVANYYVGLASFDPQIGIIFSGNKFSSGLGFSYRIPFYNKKESNLSIYHEATKIAPSKYPEISTPQILNFIGSITANVFITFEGKTIKK
jgi:hypothetical protein